MVRQRSDRFLQLRYALARADGVVTVRAVLRNVGVFSRIYRWNMCPRIQGHENMPVTDLI
jgi:hypothetical protein